MPLTTTAEMLLNAQAGNYAIGAFNVENMEMIQAVVSAAEEMSAPVILQTTPSTVKYGGLRYFNAITRVAAEAARVPVALHLDHGDSYNLALRALRNGYTSIMIDGSHGLFEDNIAITRSVVEACHPNNIPVEAELGKVGGKEDELESTDDEYTDPDKAAEFVKSTGVSSLAVAIGTAHGVYKGEPKLDLDRLSAIHSSVKIPLVLHGASGLSDEAVRECIQRGICKINFATELRMAFSEKVKHILGDKPNTFDPKTYLKQGRNAVRELVKTKIKLCGCDGKA